MSYYRFQIKKRFVFFRNIVLKTFVFKIVDRGLPPFFCPVVYFTKINLKKTLKLSSFKLKLSYPQINAISQTVLNFTIQSYTEYKILIRFYVKHKILL